MASAEDRGRPIGPRIASIDIVRGAVMILMALDHVCMYSRSTLAQLFVMPGARGAVLTADAGPRNFLWLSNIALFATGLALWLEDSLIVSTMAVGVLLPEIFWNVGFFVRLTTGRSITGLSEYMFESQRPRLSRSRSLFHVFLPPLLAWLVWLGYDERALVAMTLLALIVFPVTYATTKPEHNINWVHNWEGRIPWRLSPRAYLALLMVAFPVFVFLPTHFLLRSIF